MEATMTATSAKTNISRLLKEFNEEVGTTRKILALVPEDKWAYKPHEKSMSLQQLAVHVAEIAGWPAMMLVTPGLDFEATPYAPAPVETNAALMAMFEEEVAKTQAQLAASTDEDLEPMWILSSGEQIFGRYTKEEAIHHSYCQTIHHRAQLGVYLRLLNIPLPGSYGPSADDMNF